MLGSPYYMAPEQITDASRVDARTDIYALGAVLYEMLAGRTVFTATTFPMLIVKISTEAPQPLEAIRGDVPVELGRLVMQMLSKVPATRPETMAEVAAALRPYADFEGAPVIAPLEAPKPDLVKTTPFVAEKTIPPLSEVPGARSSRVWVLGAGLLVAVVGVGGIVLATQDDRRAASPPTSEPAPPSEPAVAPEEAEALPAGVEAPEPSAREPSASTMSAIPDRRDVPEEVPAMELSDRAARAADRLQKLRDRRAAESATDRGAVNPRSMDGRIARPTDRLAELEQDRRAAMANAGARTMTAAMSEALRMDARMVDTPRMTAPRMDTGMVGGVLITDEY